LRIFGYEFPRKREVDQQLDSFAPKEQDDGATVVSAGGVHGQVIDLEGSIRTEAEFITKYRDMANNPEVDDAINEIVNETLAMDEDNPVTINLDDLDKIQADVTDPVRQAIAGEFNNILQLLDFNNKGYDIYRRWYVDGRLFYHAVIDETQPELGIQELRNIDPRKIKKVREVKRVKIEGDAQGPGGSVATVQKTANEYYVFNERGFNNRGAQNPNLPGTSTSAIKIARDSVISIVSGVTDDTGAMVYSYMHKAIKPLNQLRALEDAVVIYRLSRAPERRVWFIDVGNLPKAKAEQYMREVMNRHKNKLIYDASTGDIKNDRKFMTMLEDYWLTRREGGRGTEVDTLPAGQNLGQMEDVLYFQKRLYKSLNVPATRLEEGSPFDFGQPTAISKDEVKFNKFIVRLRAKFAQLFIKALERQLILKGIVTYDDWIMLKPFIKFNFARDNHFTELKNAELFMQRLQQLQLVDPTGPYVGKYYSAQWVRKHILKQTDEDMVEIDQQIQDESMLPQFQDPMENDLMDQDVDQGGAGQEGDPGADADKPAPKEKSQSDEGDRDEQNAIMMAKATYDRLVNKKNKSPQDKSKLTAAVKVLAAKSGKK
jgi:hypothetical protein